MTSPYQHKHEPDYVSPLSNIKVSCNNYNSIICFLNKNFDEFQFSGLKTYNQLQAITNQQIEARKTRERNSIYRRQLFYLQQNGLLGQPAPTSPKQDSNDADNEVEIERRKAALQKLSEKVESEQLDKKRSSYSVYNHTSLLANQFVQRKFVSQKIKEPSDSEDSETEDSEPEDFHSDSSGSEHRPKRLKRIVDSDHENEVDNEHPRRRIIDDDTNTNDK